MQGLTKARAFSLACQFAAMRTPEGAIMAGHYMRLAVRLIK